LGAIELLINRYSAFVRVPVSSQPPGPTIGPGASVVWTAEVPAERIALYCRPPLEGGVTTQTFTVRGPKLRPRDWELVRRDERLLKREQEIHTAYLKMLSTEEIKIEVECNFGKAVEGAKYHDLTIMFWPRAGVDEVEAVLRKHQLHVKRNPANTVYEVWIPFTMTVDQVLEAVRAEKLVESVK
jgi:hypothetical protein